MSPAPEGDYLRRAKVAELSCRCPSRSTPPAFEHRLFPVPSHAARSLPDWSTAGRQPLRAIDRLVAGSLLSTDMSVIAQAIADREAEIERLQAEIKALTDVEQLLGASAAPPARARRSSRSRSAAAATAESKSDAKPPRKRRPMSAAEKKAVSERMTAYWAERRKKAAKK